VSARQAPLALAEDRIQDALAANPADVAALQMRARAEMLEFEPESAVATLGRALELKPKDASLLADLGSAYAQAGNWAKAHEALTAALLLKPDLASAVFNRALVNEKREARGEAIADWERYLTLDASSGWAKEAREHRDALEQLNSN
jgi:Flp pilus assembly protein TadD